MKKKILIGILIGLFLIFLWVFLGKISQGVTVVTDQNEYSLEEAPRITIQNNLEKNICFSSCYPYYLEKRQPAGEGGVWESYSYRECESPDLVENCIDPGQVKSFELILAGRESSLHRIALPVCINCKIGENFREDSRFYSNEFLIK